MEVWIVFLSLSITSLWYIHHCCTVKPMDGEVCLSQLLLVLTFTVPVDSMPSVYPHEIWREPSPGILTCNLHHQSSHLIVASRLGSAESRIVVPHVLVSWPGGAASLLVLAGSRGSYRVYFIFQVCIW